MRSRVKYRLTANRDFINLQHMSVKCAGRPLLTCTELMCGLMVRRRSAGSPAARTAPPSCSASSPRTSRRTMRCAAGRRRRVLRLSSPCHVLFPDAIHDLPMHTAAHTLSGLSPWLTDACPSASLVLHSAAQSCAASPHASRTADANSYSLCMFPSMTPRQAGPDHRAQTPWTGPGPVHHGPGRNAAHAGRRLHLHAAGADCAAVPGRAGRQQQRRHARSLLVRVNLTQNLTLFQAVRVAYNSCAALRLPAQSKWGLWCLDVLSKATRCLSAALQAVARHAGTLLSRYVQAAKACISMSVT